MKKVEEGWRRLKKVEEVEEVEGGCRSLNVEKNVEEC